MGLWRTSWLCMERWHAAPVVAPLALSLPPNEQGTKRCPYMLRNDWPIGAESQGGVVAPGGPWRGLQYMYLLLQAATVSGAG
jgi:hypothetical protein